jgi:hypothetical protein
MCSFSFCFCCPPSASFVTSRYLRAAYALVSGTRPCFFRCRKSLKCLPAIRRLAWNQSSFLQFTWLFFIKLAGPSNLSFVSFGLLVFAFFFLLLTFPFWVDFQCASTFFHLKVLFVLFGPWWQNLRRRPWRA